MSRLKILILIFFIFFTVACNNGKDISKLEDFNNVKSLEVSSPFTIATLYNNTIVMPYPNLDEYDYEIGLSHTYSFIDFDGNKRNMNANPSNKCNSGKVKECSGYNESVNQGTFVIQDKLIVIEDKFDKSSFSSYTSISSMNFDGSNVFEIDRSNAIGDKSNLIAIGKEKIYYSLSNNILVEYDLKSNKKVEITNDHNTIQGVKTIFFEDDKLYIHARHYNDSSNDFNYPILAYENSKIDVVTSNVEGFVSHINKDFYVLDPDINSDNTKSYIILYNGEIHSYSDDYFAPIGVIKYEDYLIVNYIEAVDDKRLTVIKLYSLENQTIKEIDKLVTEDNLYVNAISNNIIALTYGTKISEEIPETTFFPAYITIKDNKLTEIIKLRK